MKYDFSFSFVGYEHAAYKGYLIKKVGEKNTLLIRLARKDNQLDEVVVTGQGIDISKRRLSSNVTSIKSSELENIPSSRFDQLLQSKLPNAQIRLTGGQSGATSIIRARGVTSAFVNSTPIIYVDGVRMDNLNTVAALGGGSTQGAAISSIADIPMDNIDRVEYINGGAATTLYGSDAANGVIQIFTKKAAAMVPALRPRCNWGWRNQRMISCISNVRRTCSLNQGFSRSITWPSMGAVISLAIVFRATTSTAVV
ncbi:TonB-dependent receptor plug domain-containing protein [Paraflavitalea speifideaquila]|uniref:TonB-dependent receptor plug domain-containing protein n=1 Tax=Paraflavitalea speifideaquila TaxID=3076558 RepID=UPI0028EAB0FC|nr:TonB-dependent receptor plug domain-containing protein [Paraflavitalea speifideiaquila]